ENPRQRQAHAIALDPVRILRVLLLEAPDRAPQRLDRRFVLRFTAAQQLGLGGRLLLRRAGRGELGVERFEPRLELGQPVSGRRLADDVARLDPTLGALVRANAGIERGALEDFEPGAAREVLERPV